MPRFIAGTMLQCPSVSQGLQGTPWPPPTQGHCLRACHRAPAQACLEPKGQPLSPQSVWVLVGSCHGRLAVWAPRTGTLSGTRSSNSLSCSTLPAGGQPGFKSRSQLWLAILTLYPGRPPALAAPNTFPFFKNQPLARVGLPLSRSMCLFCGDGTGDPPPRQSFGVQRCLCSTRILLI